MKSSVYVVYFSYILFSYYIANQFHKKQNSDFLFIYSSLFENIINQVMQHVQEYNVPN